MCLHDFAKNIERISAAEMAERIGVDAEDIGTDFVYAFGHLYINESMKNDIKLCDSKYFLVYQNKVYYSDSLKELVNILYLEQLVIQE